MPGPIACPFVICSGKRPMVIFSKKLRQMSTRRTTSSGRFAMPRVLAFMALLVLAPLLASCGKENAEQSKAAATAPPPVPVGVIAVALRPTNPGLSFVGRVEAIDNVNLIARVDSFLNKRTYTEGQQVKTGTLLFVLEKNTFQASVDSHRPISKRRRPMPPTSSSRPSGPRHCSSKRPFPRQRSTIALHRRSRHWQWCSKPRLRLNRRRST